MTGATASMSLARPDPTAVPRFYRAAPRPDLAAPDGRPRDFLGRGYANERFKRYESIAAELTLSDTLGDVFVFSGHPDMIDLHARTNAALFVLDDIDGREGDSLPVAPNERAIIYVPRRRVRARNLSAGNNAVVWVVGYYIEPSAPFDGK